MTLGIVLERPDPPVFSLPRDVLEEILIFRVNNKPPVLCDVKSVSQVCRLWREIVMGCPSLWGRAISLDELNQVRDDWRTEVVRRTTTSALHIFGILEDMRTLDFVLSLMDTQWSRIRCLELDIIASLPAYVDDRWRAILRPAPLLQSFVLDIQRGPFAAVTGPRKPLFGGHAPQLNTFVPSAIDYNLQGSWTSTLRRLELTSKHPLTIPQFIQALKCMQRLEYLQLNPNGFQGNLNDVDQLMRSAYVRLPHLKYIQMDYARFWTAISLLDHLYPASGCALNFSMLDLEISTEETFGELQRVVSRHTENYYGLGMATNFHLQMSSSHFSFTDPEPRTRPMSIECAFLGSFVADFLVLFTSDSFSNVKHLLLFADSDCADDNITKFILCFPSLKTFHTRPTTIQHIYDWYRTNGDSTIPFPLLHTLHISAEPQASNEDLKLRVIFDFLVWRHVIGAPISALELEDYGWDTFNLDFLEDVKGLKVIWTTWRSTYGRAWFHIQRTQIPTNCYPSFDSLLWQFPQPYI